MHQEIIEQPRAMELTLESERNKMDEIAEKISQLDKIYLIGCGSSLSTCYSAKSALDMTCDVDIQVMTGYEFYYHKELNNKNVTAIFTSQSGETADTLASLRRANEEGIYTVVITNEKESTMAQEATAPIITGGGREEAILGTKTYITQLMCLYYIIFSAFETPVSREILEQLEKLPSIIEDLIEKTKEDNKRLAKQFKDDEIFYCMGSGPNFGLAYKLAMTMLMEGSLKHACPLYSGEFRHGLIERVEENVPVIFLNADYPGDVLTKKSIEFCEKIQAKNIIFNLKDYTDLNNLLSPFILVIPLEWFIYYQAHYNGEDPGSTRHIGKVRY
ncbi:MAG: SIS domain-containing protein [Methanobacteriaceae archaeon]|nr:SIS domain-containing protein [Methanobacteriaceae archaeon]